MEVPNVFRLIVPGAGPELMIITCCVMVELLFEGVHLLALRMYVRFGRAFRGRSFGYLSTTALLSLAARSRISIAKQLSSRIFFRLISVTRSFGVSIMLPLRLGRAVKEAWGRRATRPGPLQCHMQIRVYLIFFTLNFLRVVEAVALSLHQNFYLPTPQ